MITKVSLKNFKLHADTTIEAAPITVFIGPNNSGKSSIFQALLSLRQAAGRNSEEFCQTFRRLIPGVQTPSPVPTFFFQDDAIIDIGEFEDVKRHGESEITIKVEGILPCLKTYGIGEHLWIELEVGIRKNRLAFHTGGFGKQLRRGTVSVNEGVQLPSWRWAGSPSPQENAVTVNNAIIHFRPTNRFRLIERSTVTFNEQLPPEKEAATNELHTYLAEAPVRLLNLLHPVFPLRGFEEWGYPLPGASPQNLDRLMLADRATALAAKLKYERDMEERLSDWLEELLGIGIRAELVAGPRVVIRTKRVKESGSDSLFLNEGTGASQLPFILLPIGLAPADETILLSEPEVHLHPEAQSKLMRLLLRIAKKENKQFFIETHSEHILHALLHAVAKGDLRVDKSDPAKSDLVIYYFENINGKAKVRRLEVNEQGQVEGGLPGFFDQALDELSEYLDALKKK
ncbi:MAG: AAA family ATPase [Acidobacteria bacterium]|nr:AAA family ATPase [Acidobacteriota bacterium]